MCFGSAFLAISSSLSLSLSLALTNTIGKVFFGVISKRLEKYFISNNFISKTQKGFKAETPGCLEHSFAMFEALLDAKFNQRQIVVSWLDLKNAYGSVKHNLLQFALRGAMCRFLFGV